jgi:hypothetical protein
MLVTNRQSVKPAKSKNVSKRPRFGSGLVIPGDAVIQTARDMGSKKIILLVIGAIASFVCICAVLLFGGIFGGTMLLTGGAANVTDLFMNALKDKNYAGAYSVCAPAYKHALGDAPAGLVRYLADNGGMLASFNVTGRSVTDDGAKISGTLTFDSGGSAPYEVRLQGSASDWEVTGFDILRE